MTFKQLEVFVAIADENSFSKGADKACITQSTASQHILALEDELGTRLFDRGRGGAFLTEAGKLLLGKARKMLFECAETKSAVKRFMGLEDVVLRVGASNVPGSCLIPDMLNGFLAQHPKVRLEVNMGDSSSVLQSLREEHIELGFIGGVYEDDRICFEAVCDDEIVCVVSADYGDGKRMLSQGELCKAPLIVREDGSGTQKSVYDALAGTWIHKESLNIVTVLGGNEAVKRAVLKNVGYAFLSRISAENEISSGLLNIVRIPGVSIIRKIYSVRRKGRELSPAATAFWEAIHTRKFNS